MQSAHIASVRKKQGQTPSFRFRSKRSGKPGSVPALLLLALAAPARAAHPFITDDTNTQGSGRFELQLGTQYTRTPVDEGATLANFQLAPQLSYGAVGTLDLVLRPTYDVNVLSGGSSGRASGWGDTSFEAKWRFWQADEWSLGVRAGTGVPSGNFARGPDSGRSTPRAYLLGGWSTASFQAWANAGAIRNVDDPAARTWLGHVSADAIWSVRDGFQLGIDLAADQNPLRAASQWPVVGLIGVIHSLTSVWDVDAGYQRGLNRSAPRNQFLLGTTWHW